MACNTCIRWMVWNDSDEVQTFYYYDCNDGTTLLHSIVGAGQFYSVCGCKESGSYATSDDVYIENGGDNYINFEGFLLPPCTLVPEPSLTPSLFPTRTPNHTPSPTPTVSLTPSMTRTPNPTPSSTPLVCGSGVTTGTYYYTDCCGNFFQGNSNGLIVTLDYTKPSTGVVKLNSPASVTCLTPTPTSTPTLTPTNTITPTYTPTPSVTTTLTPSPTTTPSLSQAVRLKNDCEVFTLFDMGVQCYPIQNPSSATSNDGILSLLVTGGTSPYSFYWAGGQRTQTLLGVPEGSYEVIVVDYYGDYSSTTICSIFGPTVTPTSTLTPTPTITPSPVWPTLCFTYVYDQNTAFGPITFSPGGDVNGRPKWSGQFNNDNLTVEWDSSNLRWQIKGWTLTSGIPISNSTSTIPVGEWVMAGGTQAAQLNMTQGTCPQYLPLYSSVLAENTTCPGLFNCNGSISVTAAYGVPPYQYSIDNGVTYQSSNIFPNLCANNYTVVTKDSVGSQLFNTINVGYTSVQTNYTIGVTTQGNLNPARGTQISYWSVEVTPPLPVGVSISFELDANITKYYYEPGTGSIVDNVIVTKNNITQTPVSTTTSPTLTYSRPHCSPYDYTVDGAVKTYSLTIGHGDVISGSTTSTLEITEGMVGSNGCTTTLTQSILLGTNNPTILGGACFTVLNDPSTQGIVDHSITNTNSTPSVSLEVQNIKNGNIVSTQNCGKSSGYISRNSSNIFSFNNTIANGTYTSGYTVNVGDVLVFSISAGTLNQTCINGGLACIDTMLTVEVDNAQVFTDTDCNGGSIFTYTVQSNTSVINAYFLTENS